MYKQMFRNTSIVMFLTVVVAWIFWQFFNTPSIGSIPIYKIEDEGFIFKQIPTYFYLGLDRVWLDLIGWPILAGIWFTFGQLLSNEKFDKLTGYREPELSIGLMFGLLVSCFGGYGLIGGLILSLLICLIFLMLFRIFQMEGIGSLAMLTVSFTNIVAITVHGLAGVIFLLSIGIGMCFIAGVLYGGWSSIKYLLKFRLEIRQEKLMTTCEEMVKHGTHPGD